MGIMFTTKIPFLDPGPLNYIPIVKFLTLLKISPGSVRTMWVAFWQQKLIFVCVVKYLGRLKIYAGWVRTTRESIFYIPKSNFLMQGYCFTGKSRWVRATWEASLQPKSHFLMREYWYASTSLNCHNDHPQPEYLGFWVWRRFFKNLGSNLVGGIFTNKIPFFGAGN